MFAPLRKSFPQILCRRELGETSGRQFRGARGTRGPHGFFAGAKISAAKSGISSRDFQDDASVGLSPAAYKHERTLVGAGVIHLDRASGEQEAALGPKATDVNGAG
jgi:hypothetical protein